MNRNFLFLILLLLPNIIKAQTINQLTTALEKALVEEELTGAVWSVITADTIITGALGLKDAHSGQQLQVTDKVHVGSITKTLIAVGILRLVSQGKISLEEPIKNILPEFIFKNTWSSIHPISVKHLLNHTSGLEDARFWQIFSKDPIPETSLKSIFTKDPSLLTVYTKPGTRFSYSNMGYSLLGLIIEEVTGERYETYLDKHLLQPLGMVNSTFQFVSQEGIYKEETLAMGHFENDVTQASLPMYLRPAGQFTTTAPDMAKLAKFLMSDGKIDQKFFIEKSLLNQMGKSTSSEANANDLPTGYQFGLSYRDRYGVIGYFHRGNIIGYRATLYLFPEFQKAFFISFNMDSETADYGRFNTIFIDSLFPIKTIKEQVMDNLPSRNNTFEGYYKLHPIRFQMFAYLDFLFNYIQVEKSENRLLIHSIQNKSYSLLPMGEQLFRKEDRVKASHVFYETEGKQVLTDGLATYEKISPLYLGILWFNLILGVLGLVFLIFRGTFLLFQKRLWKEKSPIFIPFLSIVGLLLPFPFLFNQSFIELGDFTFPNVLLGIVTGALPLAMLWGLYDLIKNRKFYWLDTLCIILTLQWCMVLVYWSVLPFRLWI